MATDEDFRGFFTQHYERLCRLGFLLTGDPAQAEDPGPGRAGADLAAVAAGPQARQPGGLRPQGAGQPAPVAGCAARWSKLAT